jgi:uncharacterized integral membrane protein (TIGR00698 family)
MIKLKELPGFVLALVLATIAYYVAGLHKAFDSLVLGIIFGIIVRTILGERPLFLKGFELSPRFFIPIGMVIYGVNLDFTKLPSVPYLAWGQIILQILIIFITAIYLGRLFRLSDRLSLLLATGTGICGASAIVVAKSILKTEPEETSSSLITITILGVFGLLVYPLTVNFFSKEGYSIFCATTLHMTGLVRLAAGVLGEDAVKDAMLIKMGRTSMLIPILGFLIWFIHEKGDKKPIFLKIPWFAYGFFIMGLMSSYTPISKFSPFLKQISGFLWTLALTSIGLVCDFKKVLDVGGMPLVLGLILWVSSILIFLLANSVFVY